MTRARSPKAAPKKKQAGPTQLPGLEAVLEALREEVVALRRDVDRQTQAIARAQLEEIPRAEDFQPLADHLYAFAETAPALLAGLEGVRRAVEIVETTARSLTEVADTLVATHESWTQSLLRLPRAEDYEPLVGPLREFTRVSPVLADTLAAVVKAVTPLPEMLAPLLGIVPSGSRSEISQAAGRVSAARVAIRDSLATLPRDKTYAGAAAHLRELATVSPSLMEWMQQLPALSMPLAESIAALEEAALELEVAEEGLRQLLQAVG